jgi:Protein of unknown function (DUF3501)
MNLVRPITRADIKGATLYGPIRDDYRNRVIAMKADRRVIFERVELVFDNRFTLTLQIEETCRLENLTTDAQIGEEIRINNELMPTETSLAATLFIPLPHGADARVILKDLVGLDEHLILHLGAHAIRAAFEPGRSEVDRISAVQYVRFPLSAETKAALLAPGTPIALEIDHPSYQQRVQCPEALRASLAADYG